MNYVFIVNPKAGTHNRTAEVRKQAEAYFSGTEHHFSVFETTAKGHATEIAARVCAGGDRVRIYGFGGDGTLLEIVRGATGKENAEVGIFPVGSGNDYIRSYGEKEEFLDFEKQMNGRSIPIDMIDTKGGSAVNICSVGLDAKVAYEMVHFKALPGIGGSLAYDLALGKCLLGRIGDRLRVRLKTVEGEKKLEGDYLFALAAAGKCYGGGYMGAPKAVTNDGLLDFVLVKKPPLYKIPALIGVYKKGQHFTNPKFADYLQFYRGTEMQVESDGDIYCNRDGECEKLRNETFSLSKGSLRFILPQGVTYGIKPIRTERLIVRNWREDDFDDYMELISDPEVTLPWGNAPMGDHKEGRTQFFEKVLPDRHNFAIELTKEHKVIGTLGLQPDFRRFCVNSSAVGYALQYKHWGMGYMTEALGAVIDYAFQELELEVLSVYHFTVNDRSKAVIQKCGFTQEGTLRKGFRRFDGEVFDDVLSSITREEYCAQKKTKTQGKG